MNWEAEWIWRSTEVLINDFAYFRKVFHIEQQPAAAQIYVSCHHYAKVYVNGIKLGGYGTPAPTHPEKRKLYTTYEVGALLLAGANCITADAHYLGGNCQNSVNGLPGFRLELHYDDPAGQRIKIGTDRSWTTSVDMPHESGTVYQQNRKISAMEIFDARKLSENWRYATTDENELTAAAQLALIGKKQWPMQLQTIPEGQITEQLELTAVEQLTDPEDGMVQIFDAGRVVSGWPNIKFKGVAGTKIRIRYSENLDERGRVGHNVTNEKSAFYYDEYIMRGDECEEWQPDFSYKAFRFLEVTGYPHLVTSPDEIVVCAAHTDIPHTGSFHCSDDLLNRFYTAAIYTQRNNVLGQVVDCPHREQAQYLADTDLQAELLLYNFDAITLLEKTLLDFADAQHPDGTYPFVAPISVTEDENTVQIPEWDLHYATLMWKIYEVTGDIRTIENSYSSLARMLHYYLAIIDDATGLVPLDKGWHISDWPYPSVQHTGSYLTVQQIKMYQALRIAAKAASLLQKVDDEQQYEQAAEQLLHHINEHLYVSEFAAYRDSIDTTNMHQGVTAIALYANIVPEQDRKRAVNYIKQQAWECSTVLSLPLLRVLFDNDCADEALAIIQKRDYPGWGHMLEQGSMTLWEGWQDIESHSHAWNGYPLRLLQEYVVGIKRLEIGFTKVAIHPYIPSSLDFAEATVWTPLGQLSVRWQKTADGGVTLQVTIPAGIEADVLIEYQNKKQQKVLHAGDHVVTMK